MIDDMGRERGAGRHRKVLPRVPLLFVLGVVTLALTLRPGVTGLGAVLTRVTADLRLPGWQAGLATTLPVLCFAVLGYLAPVAAERFGAERLLVALTALSGAGLAARAAADSAAVLLTATAVAMAGPAVGNVLLPALVKRHHPARVGSLTALYTTALAVGMTAAAALIGPAARAWDGGWRTALAVLAVPAALATVVWLVLAVRSPRTTRVGPATGKGPGASVARDPVARALLVFFACQSGNAYAVFGWLPTVAADRAAPDAGALLPIVTALAVPTSILLPVLAARAADQRGLVLAVTGCYAGGWLWLLLAPAGTPGWPAAVLLGLGNGAFPLAVTLVGLRAGDARVTAALSGFVQGGGYLLAAAVPLLVGVLHQAAGGWAVPIVLVLATLLPQAAGGARAARAGAVIPVWRHPPRHAAASRRPAPSPAAGGPPGPTGPVAAGAARPVESPVTAVAPVRARPAASAGNGGPLAVRSIGPARPVAARRLASPIGDR